MVDWNRDDDDDDADRDERRDGGDAADPGESGGQSGWDDDLESNGLGETSGGGDRSAGVRQTLVGVLAVTGVSALLVFVGFAIGSVGFLAVALVLSAGFGIDLLENLALQLVVGAILLQGIGFGGAALAYLRYRDHGFEYVRAKRPTWNGLKWAIAAFVGAYVLLIAGNVAIILLGLDTQGHEIGNLAVGNPDILLVLIPLSFLLIGPGEELLFRGVIQNAFVDRVGVGGGIAASSAIFALIHLPNYGWLDGLPTICVLFVVSLSWGYVYERTDSLFVPAMAHAMFNALQFGILYLTLKYGPEMSAALAW